MPSDIMDDFVGRRTLQYFVSLLMIAVMLYVLGVVLSDLHGITLLETAAEGFIENPMVLLNIAGVAAVFVVLFLIARFVLQHVD